MKNVILFIAILSLIIINACGGKQLSEDGRTNENANSIENGQRIEAQNVNPDMLNAPSNSNIGPQHSRSIVNSPGDPNFKAKPLEVPAAYDSTVVTTMDKQNKFLETRTFKKDSQVLKVERKQELKKFTLYLKNGKVIDLPYDKAESQFLHASPADLMVLGGVKPPPTPATAVPPSKKQ